MSKKKPANKRFSRKPGSPLTIGFVERYLADRNACTVWQGIMDAARERGVNVISFLPRDLDTTDGFDAQANVLFDLINPDLLDGLIIWTGSLISYVGLEGAKRIFERYSSIPIVSIEKGSPEGVPFLEIDSYQSMREAVIHLIKDHGRRRIAFIRGPDTTHAGARERYQGYLDVLTEYGILFDPDLVSPPTDGLWVQEVGEEAIALLLDQRHAGVDAVIGACDNIAIGAMRALDARGIHIPGKVAVVGFDDETGSRNTIPPLTTMSLRGYEQGWQAVQTLLTLLDGGQIPAQTKVSPQLIIRQSCGCIDPAVAQAAAGPVSITCEPFDAFAIDHPEKALSEMRQADGTAIVGLNPGWADQLLEAFCAELKADKPGAFLSVLDGVLRQVIAVEGQVKAWANVISALRRCALPYLGNSRQLLQAEDLWLQAQVMVGETAQQAQRYQASQLGHQTQILNEIRAALITTFDINDLMETLARELPRLDIPGCYLSLYENPKQPAELSRLALAYDIRRGRLDREAQKQAFPSPRLAPEGILPQDKRYSLVTEALYFREEQLGFVMFEVGPREGPVYGMLREEISSALQGARLVQRVKNHARELERAYETLQRQQHILLATEKMASLGRLTAGIAHEMNTPLAAVRAALVNGEELVKEYEASIGDVSVTDTDHHEIARGLHSAVLLAGQSAEAAARFVRGIKSQTRSPAAQERRLINAVVAVDDALLLLSHALRQGKCEIEFEKPDNQILLVSIPGRLEQVVTNLVANAIDASYPQGGPITVRLKKHSGFVELQVGDHGSGILPENVSKIFDPMFSTKPFGSSTGMGLTIVHDIVVGELGGSIDVVSTPGKGATFMIRLPLGE